MKLFLQCAVIACLLTSGAAYSAPIKTKTVCYDRVDAAKKPYKQCKLVKIHKKLNGTTIPTK